MYNFEIYKIPIPFYMDDVGLVAYLQGCLMYIVVRRYDTKSATVSMLFYYHLWLYVSDSDCPLYIQKLNQEVKLSVKLLLGQGMVYRKK